ALPQAMTWLTIDDATRHKIYYQAFSFSLPQWSWVKAALDATNRAAAEPSKLPPQVPQGTALPPVTAVKLPTAPPALSPDCRTKRVVGDLFRRPLRGLSHAVRAKRQVRVLAIGSSTTAGVGTSSPSGTYIAKLETSLEGSLQSIDFNVVGRGLSGEVA